MLLKSSNVRPLGNSFSNEDRKASTRRRKALGRLNVLPDALLVRILDTLVHTSSPHTVASTLIYLRLTSTYLHAFASDEDLWRRLVLHNNSASTIASVSCAPSWRVAQNVLTASSCPAEFPCLSHPPPVQLPPVYSDILFHKQRCLTAQIPPEWLERDNAARISASTTPTAVFRARFEKPGIPVVIKDVVSEWPAFTKWTPESISSRFAKSTFHAGGFDFSPADYFQYCTNVASRDDQPLYIFDRDFASKVPELATEYEVHSYFAEDMFRVLGEDRRPDYRWLIAGPARSGSSFHKDPNATAAWNAVVKGEKKWVLFPPDRPPPGVVPSGDEGDVTAPVSVMEWFLNFYDRDVLVENGAVECVVKEGEMIFVPMGWWHCVLNTTTSIAITQNYVSGANVKQVADWLRERPEQVSGCRSSDQARYICRNFVRLVAEEYPHLRESIGSSVSKVEKSTITSIEQSTEDPMSRNKRKRKVSLWDTLQATSTRDTQCSKRQNESMFSFGF